MLTVLFLLGVAQSFHSNKDSCNVKVLNAFGLTGSLSALTNVPTSDQQQPFCPESEFVCCDKEDLRVIKLQWAVAAERIATFIESYLQTIEQMDQYSSVLKGFAESLTKTSDQFCKNIDPEIFNQQRDTNLMMDVIKDALEVNLFLY